MLRCARATDPHTRPQRRPASHHRRIRYTRRRRRVYASPHDQWAVGSADALSAALAAGRGDYLPYLDDDDELLPIQLEALMRLLRNASFDFVWGRAHRGTERG